ncbi:extracellular solute-binding protein [Cohnella sp. LGH]|uniref:ABC transporter substrate-binding protein n=1 Tax=Cohnella sp. LGH TaxID=1619153 RepID=UPI001ADCEBCA|nr:extracellular solute-binding protein [Cohnella sp. LGH]QTH42692.1 extracellular solute-binding protein [Cohnella sp. LGH]
MMSKKWLMIVLGAVLLLSACGNGGKSEGQSPAPSSASPSQQAAGGESGEGGDVSGTVNVLTQALEPTKMLEKFAAEHPNIKVNWETIGGGKISEVIKTRLAAGGENVDLITPLRPDYLQLAKTGQLVDLSDLPYLDNYNPAVIEGGKVDGKLYALSMSMNFYVTWYNKTMFDKHNLKEPTNWEEFLAVSEALKQAGEVPIVIGSKDYGENNHFSTIPYGSLLSDDPTWVQKVGRGEAKWTDSESIAAMEKYKQLADKGYFIEGALGIGKDQAYQIFYQGKAAMISQQVGVIEFLAANTPDFEVGAFAPPGNEPGQELRLPFSGGHTLALYNGSKNKEASKVFLEFISQTENAQLMTTEINLPSSVKGVQYDFHPIAQVLMPLLSMPTSDLMHAVVLPQTKNVLATAFQRIISKDKKTIEELAKEVQAMTDKELASQQ